MCNLYSQNTSADEVSRLFSGIEVGASAGNLAPGYVYPDQLAPIVRHRDGKLELARARWGMPTPQVYLKTARDPGVTNIRNTGSPHWRRWLGPEHRCLVPLDAFSEPGADRQPVWFEATDDRPMFFAGLEIRDWTSVRKAKDGETTDDLFALLTCPPNAEVGRIHPKAMPVILNEPDECKAWLDLPWGQAKMLQRSQRDGALRIRWS